MNDFYINNSQFHSSAYTDHLNGKNTIIFDFFVRFNFRGQKETGRLVYDFANNNSYYKNKNDQIYKEDKDYKELYIFDNQLKSLIEIDKDELKNILGEEEYNNVIINNIL